MLQKGREISFLPDYVAETAVQEKKLARIPVPDLNIEIWKQILYHKNKWISPEIQAVIDYIDVYKRQVKSGLMMKKPEM